MPSAVPLQSIQKPMGLSSVQDLIADVKAGKPVILVDDENRENEGDIIVAADCITPEHINFMITHCRGLVCMPVSSDIAARIGLTPMVPENTSKMGTPFSVSIGAKDGVTTGISAADRALTIKTAVHPSTCADDLTKPGHIFPLIAKDGGVFERDGHTEAAADIAALAGYQRAGVICEIIKDDGEMARLPDLLEFAERFGLKVGTIEDLIAYKKSM
jgi:3,4-dihydroxy 2-butanone 4-phosphate synthase/GTP cyclohydrolase II